MPQIVVGSFKFQADFSFICLQQEWEVLSTTLPRETAYLCAGVGSDDHLYVVGDVVVKLDLETETWKELPPVPVNCSGVKTLRTRPDDTKLGA